MLTVYGIRQCDTCRRALRWLDERGVDHRFHDLRVDGIEAAVVLAWLESEFAEHLVNRRSTTWRTLSEIERQSSKDNPVALLLEHPTLIKRPVFVDEEVVAVGFDAAAQQQLTVNLAS